MPDPGKTIPDNKDQQELSKSEWKEQESDQLNDS